VSVKIKEEHSMNGFLNRIRGITRFLNIIAGISLTFLMLLTISDVILRFFRMPIVGTYELVAFAGAVVIGFSLPFTSWLRAHIFVDFAILKFPRSIRDVFNIVTRSIVIILFVLIGRNPLEYRLALPQ